MHQWSLCMMHILFRRDVTRDTYSRGPLVVYVACDLISRMFMIRTCALASNESPLKTFNHWKMYFDSGAVKEFQRCSKITYIDIVGIQCSIMYQLRYNTENICKMHKT